MGASRARHRRQVAEAEDLAAGQYGVISWDQCLACGLDDGDVRRLCRQGAWRRIYPRVYGVGGSASGADLPRPEEGPFLTQVMAAQLAMGPQSFASAQTAALLWGLQGLPPWDGRTVHLTIPALGAQRHIRSITLHSFDTAPEEVTTRKDGIRLTVPGRTLRDTVLRVDRGAAVSLMDSSLQQSLLTPEDLPGLEAANVNRRGRIRTRDWWDLCDGRAQSPLETRIRLIFVDAGLPPDDLQHPLPVPELGVTYFADLWYRPGVMVEADGAGPHSTPQALYQDRRRQNALQRTYPGLRILRFSWKDLSSPNHLVAELSRCLP